MFISKTGDPFVFLSSKTVKSKNGNNFSFVTVHDPSNYENYELFYANPESFLALEKGDLVNVELIPSVYQGKVNFKCAVYPVM